MKTQVYDLMARDLFVARADDSVAQVRDLMAQRKILAVPVVGHDNEPAGIVTSTDLVLELDPDAPVSEVMTAAVHTVSPHADVHDAARMMLDHRIHHLVVTHEGTTVGILSSYDLLRVVAESESTI